MILTKEAILRELKNNTIRVEPLKKSNIGPASIDLTLDKHIRIFKRSQNIIPVRSSTDFSKITTKKTIQGKYILKPGELVLGITKEKITLPGDICGWLQSRSRFARLGLMVHITAPFMQPGISNRQVLEIYNAGPNNLALVPGEKVCHFIFQRCEGNAKYSGKFKNQEL